MTVQTNTLPKSKVLVPEDLDKNLIGGGGRPS